MAAGKTPRPWRPLAFVAIVLVALYAAVFLGKNHTPQLGLDLRGGTTVTLTPRPENGGKVTPTALAKAVDIIRQRVNRLGVAEAEVVTEGNNIVASVPGKGRSEVLDLVGKTAQLRFRQVLQEAPATTAPTPTPSASQPSAPAPKPSTSLRPQPTPSRTSNGRAVPPALAAATPSPSRAPAPTPSAAVPATLEQRFARLDCRNVANRTGGATDIPAEPIATCDKDGTTKYLLAPAEVVGTDVHDAAATVDPNGIGGWRVELDFTSAGRQKFGDLTKRVQPLQPPKSQVAIVLDGVVQSAPVIQTPILDGRAEITGNFTEKEAKDLASVLKYGALPISFDVPTAETVSPTLGDDQLRGGLIAGAIGLALVILYSLVYYRGLGLVTIASLALSGLLLYPAVTLLGHTIGYTLTLAGIAGFIVAVGITADSFVVFFERLRDEVREGRTMRSGVERAWIRARRTIISADTVSLLAAIVLYLFSIGSVKGFAFTLGLSTLCDLFIVFFFTKPLVTLMGRSRVFGAATRLSGLSAGRRGRTPTTTGAQEA